MTTEAQQPADAPAEPTAAGTGPAGGTADKTADGGPPNRTRAFIDALTTANSVTVTILAIVLALVIGGLTIVFSDEDVLATTAYIFSRPQDFFTAAWQEVSLAYSALLKGAIVDPDAVSAALSGDGTWTTVFGPISETLTNAAPLICTGLAVALAFRAGLFNIGAEGQVVAGVILAGFVGFGLSLPPGIHLVVALLAAIVGGGLWGGIAGWLKARTGAHEVITTIMLNYIAGSLLVWLLSLSGIQRPGRSDAISKATHGSADFPHLAGDVLRVHLGILLAVALAAGVSWLLQRSTLGFEFRAVGSNPVAARTAGMSVAKAYVLAMVVSGGLAGLGGASVLLGTAHALTPAVSSNIGFDGITVALLGRAKPWGVVAAGLLFGALRAGAVRMQAEAAVPVDMVTVIQALIVIFIAAPALVKAVFRLRAQRAGTLGQTLAKGWNG